MSGASCDLVETLFEDIVPCANIAIYSPRRSGKTTFICFLLIMLHTFCKVHRTIVFCGNRASRAHYSKVVHPLYIHGPDLKVLAAVLAYQEDRVGEASERFEEEMCKERDRNPDFLAPEFEVPDELKLIIVSDDNGSNKAFSNSKEWKSLTADGRHFGAYPLTAYQKATQTIPEVRDNADYTAILACQNEDEITRLHKEYVGDAIVKKKPFTYIMSTISNVMGHVLWIKNDGTGVNFAKKVMFGRVPDPRKSKFELVGSTAFINFARKHYVSVRRQRKELKAAQGGGSSPKKAVGSSASSVVTFQDEVAQDALESDDELDAMTAVNSNVDQGSVRRPGSVLSLNRQRHVPIGDLRAGRQTFQDARGNVFNVNLRRATTKGIKAD
jgi:hypothetical protein